MNGTRTRLAGVLVVAAALVSGGTTLAEFGDGPPVVSWTRAPRIPSQAEESRAPGKVKMLVLVRENGHIGSVRVIESEPRDVGFESSARRAVGKWRFSPAREQGETVEAYVVVEINFHAVAAAPRVRYRTKDWFYQVSVANRTSENRVHQVPALQRVRIQALSYFRPVYNPSWDLRLATGMLPGPTWWLKPTSCVLRPAKNEEGTPSLRTASNDETLRASIRLGEMYQRSAAGPEPVQIVSTPGVVRPQGFDWSSSFSTPTRSMSSMTTRSTRTTPTRQRSSSSRTTRSTPANTSGTTRTRKSSTR